MYAIAFAFLGYLSGSVLYARIFARLFKKENMIEKSKDRNPGTANAFMHGGFWCGVLTLIFDLLKGFLPVFLFLQFGVVDAPNTLMVAAVLAAPVIGHAFPLFFRFKGGKGIAVSFGCLLGLLPLWQPFAALAVFFIFFSVVFKITPHFHRTLAAYICSLAAVIFNVDNTGILIGFLIITLTVVARLMLSKEKTEKIGVKLLWMR